MHSLTTEDYQLFLDENAKERGIYKEFKMKKVKVFKYERIGNNNYFDRVYNYDALFHQFGVDCEEFETGAGNYSTAIIELETGEVKNIPVELITFIK